MSEKVLSLGDEHTLPNGRIVRAELDENGVQVNRVIFNPVPEPIAEYVGMIPGVTASEFAWPMAAMRMMREGDINRAWHDAHYMSPVEVALRGAVRHVNEQIELVKQGNVYPDTPEADTYYKAHSARNAFLNMYMECGSIAERDWRAGVDNSEAHAAADAAAIAAYQPTTNTLNSGRVHPQ